MNPLLWVISLPFHAGMRRWAAQNPSIKPPAPVTDPVPGAGTSPGEGRTGGASQDVPTGPPSPGPCNGHLELMTFDYDCGCRTYYDPHGNLVATERHPPHDLIDDAELERWLTDGV